MKLNQDKDKYVLTEKEKRFKILLVQNHLI